MSITEYAKKISELVFKDSALYKIDGKKITIVYGEDKKLRDYILDLWREFNSRTEYEEYFEETDSQIKLTFYDDEMAEEFLAFFHTGD